MYWECPNGPLRQGNAAVNLKNEAVGSRIEAVHFRIEAVDMEGCYMVDGKSLHEEIKTLHDRKQFGP